MPVRTLRLIVLALIAALAGGAACLLPGGSQTPRPPAFLASALGTTVAGTPERLTDAGESVSLPRSGYELQAGTDTLALSSEDQDGDSWHQFEAGATRSTPFGSETVVVDGNVVEQFLTVEQRTGPKRWRWKLETGTLKPSLRADGSVLVSPGNIVAGFRILPAAILDSRGKDVSPDGTHWDLEREDGDWFLALDVDDAELPLPYVIDPATLGLTDVASAANASATTLVIPKPAALALDDQMVAQVTARTSTFICAPAGWTSVDRRVNGVLLAQEIFRKTAVAADVAATNFTFTLDGQVGCPSPNAVRASGGIIAVYGVDNSSPITAVNGQANASSTNIIAPGITVGVGDGLVGFYGTANGTTITEPGGLPGFFELWEIASATFTTSQLSGTIVTAAGPTGNKTATAAAAAVNIGQLVGLRVDATLPTAPVLTVTETDADTHVIGSTLFYRPGGNGGTFGVAATATDGQSGLQRITFPGLAGSFTPTIALNDTTSPYAQTYTWTAGATDTGAKTVTSEDNATNQNTSTFTLTSDSTGPPTTVTANEGANAGLQHFVNTGANAYTLYYRPTATGDLTFSAVATDAAAGTLNVTFPTLATTGFTGTTLTDAVARVSLQHLHVHEHERGRTAERHDRLHRQRRQRDDRHGLLQPGHDGAHRRRADGQQRRGERRRHAELRHRRHLHDRHAHRLHRRRVRHRHLDADARDRHAPRRRLLRLRRTDHPRRRPGRRPGSRPAATATSSPAPTTSATPSPSRQSSRSIRATRPRPPRRRPKARTPATSSTSWARTPTTSVRVPPARSPSTRLRPMSPRSSRASPSPTSPGSRAGRGPATLTTAPPMPRPRTAGTRQRLPAR